MESFSSSELFILLICGIGIMMALGLGLIYFYFKTKRKILVNELETQKKLLETTILTQERERKRIAEDLHDEIGAKLNLIHLFVQKVRGSIHENEVAQGTVNEIIQTINLVIDTTRRISHDLLPPVLEEFGLEKALIELAESYSKSDQLSVSLEIQSDRYPLANPLVELNLFRILQELLSNTIKHGAASKVDIHLAAIPKQLKLSYEDNGVGFDLDRKQMHGLGMKNIRSRSQIINAKWDFSSSQGQGFRANLLIPNEI